MASTAGPESASKVKAAADAAPGDGLVLVNRLKESRSPYVRDELTLVAILKPTFLKNKKPA